MTVGEDSVEYRKYKKYFGRSNFGFYRWDYNLIASLSHLEALFLDVTSDALKNCSFLNKESKI